MAKRKTASEDVSPIGPRVRKHLAALGCGRRLDEYHRWCAAHGFRATTDKTHAEMEAEMRALAADKAHIQQQARVHQNPRKLIEAVCAGRIGSPAVQERPHLQRFCRAIEKSRTGGKSREALAVLLRKVHDEADFLFEYVGISGAQCPYVDALIKLNDRRGSWIRPLDDWQPSTHNARRQFSSLARHLLARFPVPAFMDQAWFRSGTGSHKLRDWFVHIGNGRNIRSADTPIPLTKMMAHHFMQAPDDITIEGALRWGQIHALGGDKRLLDAVLGSRIGRDFANDEFWTTVIRFFIANPMMDRRHVGPVIDYLNTQKFEARQVFAAGRGLVAQPPPQPNLSMRGRTAGTLLEQVECWHRELGRSTSTEGLHFQPSGIKPLELVSGRDRENVWRVRELLSGAELTAEGKAMRHCVASYARSCAAGRCSIWTMELITRMGLEKRQTIEVLKEGLIVQCRGKQNRLPTPAEFEVLKEWARFAGLAVGSYVRAAA